MNGDSGKHFLELNDKIINDLDLNDNKNLSIMIGNRIIVLVFLNIIFIFSSNIDFNLKSAGLNISVLLSFHFESYSIT